MDSDTLQRKDDYRRILTDFRTGKIDILVGTQMIAKGLHFPNVTLVGIIHADLGLHVPDFRAGERTFQLLTQVSGRAGRGDVEGEVFVQTFTPFHPAIQFARRHDYLGFYEQEMEFREQLKYPPWSRVALLTVRGRNEEKVKLVAEHLKKTLATQLESWRDLDDPHEVHGTSWTRTRRCRIDPRLAGRPAADRRHRPRESGLKRLQLEWVFSDGAAASRHPTSIRVREGPSRQRHHPKGPTFPVGHHSAPAAPCTA
jgi:primosomal protein N'